MDARNHRAPRSPRAPIAVAQGYGNQGGDVRGRRTPLGQSGFMPAPANEQAVPATLPQFGDAALSEAAAQNLLHGIGRTRVPEKTFGNFLGRLPRLRSEALTTPLAINPTPQVVRRNRNGIGGLFRS